MIRRLIIAGWLVVALVATTGCRTEDNTVPEVQIEDRIIQTAGFVDGDPSQLLVTWDPVECETFQEVQVELDDTYANLLIKVVVDVAVCPPSGQNQTVVDLGEPLGDRRVWDRAFGDTVALES